MGRIDTNGVLDVEYTHGTYKILSSRFNNNSASIILGSTPQNGAFDYTINLSK